MTGNTSAVTGYTRVLKKFKSLNSRKITSLLEIKRVIWHVILIIAENKLHAQRKSICIQ